MIVWTESLSVGISDIDNQHKELYKRIDSLVEAMGQGKGRSEIDGVVAFLEKYVADHFDDEEMMMSLKGYPQFIAHKAMHTGFAKAFIDLKVEIAKGGARTETIIQIHRSVVDWLDTHISVQDRAFGEFIRAEGLNNSQAA